MYPHRFNPSHSRPHRDRSPRPWNSQGDSWERRDSHRERERPVHYKYSVEGASSRRDYSTSPKRPYKKDSFDADRSRRSPLRRRTSFEGDGGRHNHDNGSDSEERDYRFRHVSEGKRRQWSSDRSDVCGTKDFEDAEFQEKDLRHTKRSPDYRHRHHCEEVTYRHPRDSDSRPSSARNMDRDGAKSGYWSSERKPSEGQSSKYYESDVAQNRAAVCQPSTSANGFQRFLDLLNKGVDVDMLNKIVSQTPSNHQAHSTPDIDGQHDVAQQQCSDTPPRWQVFEQSGQRPLSHQRSFHPIDSRSRSRSPQKVALTLEDEHKHKQMQDVLQAIGLNLGFEELGQMSHRIQERLYGKKESDGQGSEGKSKEKDLRKMRLPPPRSQSRSSSSSRSRSQSSPERHTERYLLSTQTAGPGDQQRGDQHGGHQYPRDQHMGDPHSGKQHLGDKYPGDQHLGDKYPGDQHSGDWHPSEQHLATSTYQRHYPPTGLPAYPPANYPPLPCRPPPPPLPHIPLVPTAFLPPRPPFLRPPLPPLNMFPPQTAHMPHCPPQYTAGPQQWFNPSLQPVDNNNYQKAKTQSRPRCLQVIETKQAG